jgi:hypothetical protein
VASDKQSAAPIIPVFAAFAGLIYLGLDSIPFLDSGTVFLFGLCAMLTVLIMGGVADDSKERDKLVNVSVACACCMSIVLFICDESLYAGNTDMISALSKYDITSKGVKNKVVLAKIDSYPSVNPASLFLRQFLMTSPHPSGVVWENVKIRAQYLSKIYTEKLLPDHATVPHFGFLHSNNFTTGDVLYSLKGIPDHKRRAYFYAHRKLGYTVSYTNGVDNSIADIVDGKSSFLHNFGDKMRFLKTVSQRPLVSPASLQMLPSVSKQLGNTINVQDAVDIRLGAEPTATKILNTGAVK